MTSPASDPVPAGMYVPTADSRVLMQVDWDGYQSLLALRGERRRPRLAYLDGVAELMTTSRDHERIKSRIGDVIRFYCVELGIPINPFGNWTLSDRSGDAGAEPDECFIFGADPETKPRPDLAIEVIWTSGGIDKLEIYRRLGVREVWFWDDDAISIYVLDVGAYSKRVHSVWLPDLATDVVRRLEQLGTLNEMVAALKATL
ncbi:MAG: Uma2 family endonuclease [Kofleriaceae bacterium]